MTAVTSEQPRVGFMCDAGVNEDLRRRLDEHPSLLYRIVVMSRFLAQLDTELFVYSPAHIDPETISAPGYVLSGDDFEPVVRPLPAVNGSWAGNRLLNDGMGYETFKAWSKDQDIEVYVPCEFSSLSADKYRCYRLIAAFDPNLQPYTERYRGTRTQFDRFLGLSDIVFLKPTWGHKGDDILVVRRQQAHFLVEHYFKKKTRHARVDDVRALRDYAGDVIQRQSYVIQQGIATDLLDGRVFDIRINVISDGSRWHHVSQGRIGAGDKQVANYSQGGDDCELEPMLRDIYGEPTASGIRDRVIELSLRLARYLESYYPRMLIEIAFDFVVDRRQRILLTEINSKPGLVIPRRLRNVFDIADDDREVYEKFIRPHGTYLAQFLHTRLRERHAEVKPWFEDLGPPLALSSHDQQQLIRRFVESTRTGRLDAHGLSAAVTADRGPRIVFASVSDGAQAACVGFAAAGGLIAAVTGALTRLHILHNTEFRPVSFRLDIVEHARSLGERAIGASLDIAPDRDGIAFDRGIGVAFLPRQLVSASLIDRQRSIRPARMLGYLSGDLSDRFKRVTVRDRTKLFAFSTTSLFADTRGPKPGGRGAGPTPDLDGAIGLAADYLRRNQRADGGFAYRYLPKTDSDSTRDDLGRQAAAAEALLLVPRTLVVEPSAADRAIEFLLQFVRSRDDPAADRAWLEYRNAVDLNDHARVTGCLARYIDVRQAVDHLPLLRALANGLLACQREDGAFLPRATGTPSGPGPDEPRATFAPLPVLMQVMALDSDPKWRSAVVTATGYLLARLRDHRPNLDGRLIAMLVASHRITEDERLIAEARSMTEDLLAGLSAEVRERETKAVAIAVEELGAAYDLAETVEDRRRQESIRTTLDKAVPVLLRRQFRPESAMFLPRPDKALGGFAKGITAYAIRLDTVYRALYALLAARRVLC